MGSVCQVYVTGVTLYSRKQKKTDKKYFSYESTFISYICICTPKVQHLLICRNRFLCIRQTEERFHVIFFVLFLIYPPSLPHPPMIVSPTQHTPRLHNNITTALQRGKALKSRMRRAGFVGRCSETDDRFSRRMLQ